MNISNAVRILRRSTLFAKFGDDRLNVLAFSAERRAFAAGETLMEPGDEPAECLLVLKGRLEMRSEGAAVTAYSIGPGGTVGEIALIRNTPATTLVSAVAPGEVLVISRPLFERMIGDFPDIASLLHQALAARLATLVGELRAVELALRHEPRSLPANQIEPQPARDPTPYPNRAPRRTP